MPDGFTIDTTELDRLAVDLGKVPSKVLPDVTKVLEKSAVNIKKGMQDRFKASAYFKGVARDVTYDPVPGLGAIGYEIGPVTGRGHGHQGGLAGIAVEGGAHGGGGTVHIDDLLPTEADALEKYLGDVLGGAL